MFNVSVPTKPDNVPGVTVPETAEPLYTIEAILGAEMLSALALILIVLSNKISVWFDNSNDNEKQLSTGIKLTAATLFVCLVFDFEIFSYMLHDGFNMLDFLYYTITLIALASFVFNKKLAKIILKNTKKRK